MFQRGAPHNQAPGRPPGASANAGQHTSQRGQWSPTTCAVTSSSNGGQQQQQDQKSPNTASRQQQQDQKSPNTASRQQQQDQKSPNTASRQQQQDQKSPNTASRQQQQDQKSPNTASRQQQQDQKSPNTASRQQQQDQKSPNTASRLAGKSLRNRRKSAGGSSAPSTPRGERDVSRDRSAHKSSTADGADGGNSEKGATGAGRGVRRRTSRSLNRTNSKRLSAPPTDSASSRALAEVEAELSVDARAPGVIRLFGESVVRGAQYKAVLASTRSTSQELIKQALERYGLPSNTFRHYVLCDSVGIVHNRAEDADDNVDHGNKLVLNHVDADDNSDPSYASIGAVDSSVGCSNVAGGVNGGCGAKTLGGWIPVSTRILDDADRPLELQRYWKPPEGLSRRFELHRRDDVIRETSVDDTSGLNDNARRIMMSKVPPGAIPPLSLPLGSLSPETVKRKEGNYVKTGADGRVVQPLPFSNTSKDNYLSVSSPDSEVKYAYICPSIYPYLLTLRGYDIKKDLVLYPLKSKTLTLGRNPRRSHADDIGLLADDVLDLHCRIHLKTLSADTSSGPSADKRRYWYCLQVEVIDRALVFVNGQRVEHSATIQPGDLLGVGHHYLFLYKDPTGGHDIPDTLPWYPGPSCLYAKVKKAGSGNKETVELDSSEQDVLKAMVNEVNNQEYFDLDDLDENGSTGEMPLTVPYPPEREGEVLEHIAGISYSSPSDFPLTTTVLMMGCHGYASRRFPPSHQAGFFRRMLRAVRNRVSVVSKALSVQKYQSNLYAPSGDGLKDDSRDGDPLLELLCWLANVVRIYNHVTSAEFRSRLAAPQPPADVMESLQELCDSLEEMISFMFQQTVYSITKVLFAPVGQILQPPGSPSGLTDNSRAVAGMERVLHVFRTTLDVSEDVSLHRDVIIQLLTYLIFFVTTTLFNKLMSKGSGNKHFCWSVGVRLQACVSSLEEWVSSVGLEAQYLRVSERLLSLVDLLATSRHTLLRMDWPSFGRQYSPLSETQLLKVLTEYQFTDGQTAPASWLPPPGVQQSDDVTVNLSSHPPFVLARQGPGVDLKETFPPVLYAHLDNVTKLFSKDTAAGSRNEGTWSETVTPRQSDIALATPRAVSSQGTFFTSESLNISSTHHRPAAAPPAQQHRVNGNGAQDPQSPPLPERHKPRDDGSPPPIPPKLPPRTCTIQFADPPVQPFPEHRATGVLSPRNSEQSVRNASSRVPIPSSQDYASVIRSEAAKSALAAKAQEHSNVNVSDVRQLDPASQERVRQEPIIQDRVNQNARIPQYSVPVNHNSSNARSQDYGTYPGPHQTKPSVHNLNPTEQQLHQSLKREPPPYHKVNSVSHDRHYPEEKRDSHQNQHQTQDPRRRPLNGMILSNGPLSLQDKRIINNVPPLEIPSSDLSTASDSAISDDVFIQSCTDIPPLTRGSSVQSSDFCRFSTGMLSKERADEDGEDKPEVVKVDMHQESNGGHVTVEKYPDDIYIDVVKELEPSGSARQLKVLPLDDGASDPLINGYDSDPSQSGDAPRVRYRHKMPQERDSSTKGEITGEVFTLTLLKEGSRLGMGLIDGMYTPLKLPGIYVRNVLPGTPAALCGHIRVGDRILAVNGRSIVGADYNSAMKLIRSTGPRLNLLIAKCDRSVTARISAS